MDKKVLSMITVLALFLIIFTNGCSKSNPVTQKNEAPQENKIVLKAVSLADQVRQSKHFKMFPTLIAEKEKFPDFDYADVCMRCHSETVILRDSEAKMSDFFAGGKYADQRQGITCIVCHNFEGDKMISLKNPGWESCTVCHTAGNITLGKEVHHAQKEMIEGVGVGEVKSKPSYKWAAMKETFTCTDCHVTDGQKHDFMVPGVTATYDALGTARLSTQIDYQEFNTVFKQDKCVTCHYEPANTINKIREHQTDITNLLEDLKPKIESWEKRIDSLPKDDPKIQQFKNILTYYTYVTSDASKGAHNYALSKDLLEKAESEIDSLR